MSSEKSTIKIFCRIKPTPGSITPYDIGTANQETREELLQLSLKQSYFEEINVNPFNSRTSLNPTINKPGYHAQHRPEQYSFRFTKVFDRKATQDCVFSQVAAPVIDSALEGYNGTIFAYGQTGSGKTFTMTGSREAYDGRGIIPRTLEYIFDRFKQENNPRKVRNVFISYLEIYNEGGYDLLNANSMPGRLEDLGKVTLMEDANKEFNLRNLSIHSIESVEDAINFLYLGDHNRTIAETPLNEASTRSHCIFTIYITIRDVNSSLTCRSKLNLVDLAGSERIGNSSITGQLLTEARHINLALHYLEQVIVALSDNNRTHVPYRNSMMTSVLRDSLGGNCMTTMIATLSLEPTNVQETLATCRFAQRVALVTNTVARNEELDPTEIIAQLRQEIKKLRETIASAPVKPLKGIPQSLNEKEKFDCQILVEEFLTDPNPEAILPIIPDMRLIQECFRLLKSALDGHVQPKPSKQTSKNLRLYASVSSMNQGSRASNSTLTVNDQLTLSSTLARRDVEIKVLMEMLKKEKNKSRNQSLMSVGPSTGTRQYENRCSNSIAHSVSDTELFHGKVNYTPRVETPQTVLHPVTLPQTPDEAVEEIPTTIAAVSESKKQALLTFMQTYPGTNLMETLRSKMRKRKKNVQELEKAISSNRAQMENLKSIIHDNNDFKSPELPSLKDALITQKKALATQEEKYNHASEQVRIMENNLQNQYKKLMIEFEKWWYNNQDKIGSNNNKDLKTDEQFAESKEIPSVEAPVDLYSFEESEFEPVYPYNERFHELGPIHYGMSTTNNFVNNTATETQSPEVINSHFESSGDISISKNMKSGNMMSPSAFGRVYDDESMQYANEITAASAGFKIRPINRISPNPPPSTPIIGLNAQLYPVPTQYQTGPLTYTNESQGFQDSRVEETRPVANAIPLTGDPETDHEIVKFLRTRNQIFQTMLKK